MAALWCSQCKQVLALAKDLRWFQDGSSDAVSLCSVPGTLLDSIEYKEPSLVGGKSKVQRKLHCKQCDEDIGARTKLGLCSGRDCFSYKKTVFVESQGKKFPGAKWKSVLQELCQAGVAELVSIAEGRPSATDPKVSIVLADPESLTDDTLQQLTKFELRDYQLEMTRAALKANSLICLPTGSGKTLIAAAVMHAMLRLNPQKMAVFVVNNVALVEQQARQLRQQIPHATVIAVHGQLEDEMEVRRAYKIARDRGADALVVTCGLLNGWLLSEDGMRMCDVCCLVLDEAHHATGNSDYVNLMKRFWMPLLEIYRPLVMGLTASPVDGTGDITDQKFSTQLDNLKTALQCRLCTPQNCSVYDHIALPTAYAVCAESPSHKDEHLREQIESYLKKLMLLAGNLHVTGLFDACDSATSNKMRSLLRKELKKSRSKIKELGPVANEQAAQQRDKCMKLQLILEHLQDVLEVFDVNEVVGWTNATQVLINLFEKIKEGQHGTASKEQKAKHDLLCPVFKTWHADLARDRPPQEIREAVVSSRCQELVKILKEFIETEEAGQAIVFVGMRKTAKKLTTFLATKCPDIGLKLHPEAVVGHGQAGADGMEFEGQQDQVLNNFRRGFTRLLVATCVLEEGIDIPKCSLVVRFDEDTPIRALIQSRGRARAKDGRLIVICTSSKRVELLCNTVNQEHLILEALRKEMKRTDIHGGCGELPEACAKQELEVNPDTAPRWRPPPSASGQEVSKYPEWGADFGQDDLICDLTFGHGEDGDTTSDDGCESGTDGADFVQLAFTGIFTRQMYPPEDTMKSRLHGICDVLHWNKIVLPVRDILGVIEHHDFWVRPPGCAEYADDQRKFEREFWQHYFSEGHDDVWLQIHKKPNLAGRAVRLQVAKFTLGSWYNHHEFIAGAELGSVLRLSLDHSEREIVIEVDEVFSVEFNFWEVQDFIVVHASPDLTDVALHLTLRHPPRLYKVLKAEGTNVETRNRLTEIKEASGKIVDSDCFARCLTYRLQLANPENKEAPFTPNITKCLKLFHGVGKRIFFAIVRKVPSADGGQSWNAGISPKCKHHSDPEVNYAWCCIRSSSGFVAERFDDVFFEELSHVPGVVACECLYIMVHDLGRSLFGTPASLFKRARWTYFNRSTVDGISGEGHAKVRRMVLTPTRMVFFEPDTMQTNRVLRRFDSKNFIRVSIRDENLDKLSTIKGEITMLLKRVAEVMKTGFKAGNVTHYKYLAASNSQMREHACYFVEEGEETATGIRRWIGDIKEHNVAKYAARLGLGFSTSKRTVAVEKCDICEEPDVKRNGYTFTDGIGRLSRRLANKIAEALLTCWVPSAYQIRFGGSKGVLVMDSQQHSVPPGTELVLRKSMIKYNSEHNYIEVLDTSRPIRLTLNQQIIMLLSNLGVSDSAFLHLLKTHLAHLAEMFTSESLAQEKVKNIAYAHSRKLEEANVHITSEPYLRSLLMAMYRSHIKSLLEKSKVPIDDSKARVLMGVVDDTKTLQYGEVFVQYSANFSEETNLDSKLQHDILNRMVVVAKNPCLHPGDVRTFRAVNKPELHHLCDCIVFPCLGPRPHPNELSGSDLDGDLYHVVWDDNLMPTQANKEAMNYETASRGHDISGDVTIEHIIQHVCDFIEYDTLGIIDTLHLALADASVDGVECEDCLKLAEQHAKAVDAPKSGDWQRVDREIQEKVRKYPDFMMKTWKPCYPSERVLGKMFRECNKYMNVSRIGGWWGSSSAVEPQKMFHVSGFETFQQKAAYTRAEYNSKLDRIMKMYGVRTEAELMSGYIDRLHEKVHDKEVDEVKEAIKVIRQKLIRQYRQEFEKDVANNEEAQLQKASAWYFVTYGDKNAETYLPDDGSLRNADSNGNIHELPSMRFLSFPWIVGDLLAKIYVRNMEHGKWSPMQSVATIIANSIEGMHKEQLGMIRRKWKSLCAILQTIRECIWPIGLTFMTGLSAALLSGEQDALEFAILPRRREEAGSRKKMIESVNFELSKCSHLAPIRIPDHTGLELLKFSVHGAASKCTVCQITTLSGNLKKWSLLARYISEYPELLPVLRLLVAWMKCTLLVGRVRKHIGSGRPERPHCEPHLVPFMFINMCLKNDEIQAVDGSEVVELYERATAGEDVDLFVGLHQLLDTVGKGGEKVGREQMGKLLLRFFRHSREHLEGHIDMAFLGVLFDEGHVSFQQLLGSRAAGILLDEMDRAYHSLSLHADASVLLRVEVVEKLFFVDMKAAHTIIGHEAQFGAMLKRAFGAKAVVVHPRVSGKTPGLVVKVQGTGIALWEAERAVRTLNELCANDERNKAHFARRASAVPNCYLYLLEGADSPGDKIDLEVYRGHCHPQHDYLSKVTVRISKSLCPKAPSGSLDRNFYEFLEHFRAQLVALERSFEARTHGECELRIQFGLSYVISPPQVLLDEERGRLSEVLAAMEEHGKYVNPVWQEAVYGRRESTRRHVDVRDSKYGEGQGRTSFAFFPMVVGDGSSLREWMSRNGLTEVEATTKTYRLVVARGTNSESAQYDENLHLAHVEDDGLRWLVTAVKRQRQPKSRTGRNTGSECDIRFLLTTSMPRDGATKQATAKGLEDALLPSRPAGLLSPDEQMPSVKSELMENGEACSLTMEERNVYGCADSPGILSEVRVEWVKKRMLSRPAAMRFTKAESYEEVQLKFPADRLRTADSQPVGQHLEGLWLLAFEVSDAIQNGALGGQP